MTLCTDTLPEGMFSKVDKPSGESTKKKRARNDSIPELIPKLSTTDAAFDKLAKTKCQSMTNDVILSVI